MKTVVPFACVLAVACGSSGPTPDATPCDQKCSDGTAVRGMRETMKLVFNLTFQGKPVGEHDYSFPCPLGGKARVFGTAQSNPIQGATEIDLTYELDACKLMQRDKEPSKNYDLVVSGTLKQKGIIAVQPSATTALGINSDVMKIEGNVYDPPLPFNEAACPILFAQDGNRLTGTLCGRPVTIDL